MARVGRHGGTARHEKLDPRQVQHEPAAPMRSSRPKGNIPDPIWPELSFDAIYRIAFKDRVIRSLDHPVVKRLRGG